MKTKQFIHEILELSLTYKIIVKNNKNEHIHIWDSYNHCVASLSLTEMYLFDTLENYFNELPFDIQESLFLLLTRFSTTPISERNELSIEEQAINFIHECINENISFMESCDILESSHLLYRVKSSSEKFKLSISEDLKNRFLIYEFFIQSSSKFLKLWSIEQYKMSKGE